jgi:hypothetical protein
MFTFMFVPCISSIKALLLFHNDAHNHKITGIKTYPEHTLCLERLPEPHLASPPHHITISEEFIQLLDTFQMTSEDTLVTSNIIHLFTTVAIGRTLVLLSW